MYWDFPDLRITEWVFYAIVLENLAKFFRRLLFGAPGTWY